MRFRRWEVVYTALNYRDEPQHRGLVYLTRWRAEHELRNASSSNPDIRWWVEKQKRCE